MRILETYLIFSATGRQGSSVVDALLAKNANIVGTSRNPESLRTKRGMLYYFTIRVVDVHEIIATSVLKILCSLTTNFYYAGGTIDVVQADMSDTTSIIKAIDNSKATRVWFNTDSSSVSKPIRANEAQLGYNVIDAIKQRSNQVKHVVLKSSGVRQTFFTPAPVELIRQPILSIFNINNVTVVVTIAVHTNVITQTSPLPLSLPLGAILLLS